MEAKELWVITFIMQGGERLCYGFDNQTDWSTPQSDLMDTVTPPLWISFSVEDDEGNKKFVSLPTSKIVGIETSQSS